MQPLNDIGISAGSGVSILIRPEGRMQPCPRLFAFPAQAAVSILIRPSGRMQRRRPCCPCAGLPVSILIRPEGRMQHRGETTVTLEATLFQSSSGQKAGCNAAGSSLRCSRHRMFQSSSGQKAGCNPFDAPCTMPDVRVSILIRPSGRMQRHTDPGSFNPHPARRPGPRQAVSILIRPEGRMQLAIAAVWAMGMEFQSSSGQKAGCNFPIDVIIHRSSRFNPHPARRPDATLIACSAHVGVVMAFQSSSGQKAGCNGHWITLRYARQALFQSSSGQKAGCNWATPMRYCQCHSVSILIRPEGRMQPPVSLTLTTWAGSGFNPHPARRPDATTATPPCGPWEGGFQSSSGQKAGCNASIVVIGCAPPVSILIRPEGRMQLSRVLPQVHGEGTFQSSSGQKAGCNLFRAGPSSQCCYVSILIRPEGRMQPRPCCPRLPQVSILIQPEGRMQLEAVVIGLQVRAVSILIRPEGRMQPNG